MDNNNNNNNNQDIYAAIAISLVETMPEGGYRQDLTPVIALVYSQFGDLDVIDVDRLIATLVDYHLVINEA